jgi:hypothetical protein
MKNFIIIIGCCVGIILGNGCNDDISNHPIEPSGFQLTSFPLEVGNHWQYLRVNNFDTDIRDTIDCYVLETDTLINGNGVLLLQYEDNQSIFLQEFLYIKDDTISYYNQFGHLMNRFIFPMEKGDKYPGSSPIFEVLEDNSMYDAFGYSYDSTTLIQHIAKFPNYDLLEKFHIKRNIGIVVRIIDESDSWAIKKETWVLMDYDL